MSGQPPLHVLREAARRAVERTSARSVAADVGLTPRGLRLFMAGEGEPRESTVRKLREWYVREGEASGDTSAQVAAAAVAVLLSGVPPRSKDAAEREVLEALASAYRRAKVPLPPWLEGFGEQR